MKKRIPKVSNVIKQFIAFEQSSGLMLIGCTVLSLILANASFGASYLNFWHSKLGGQTVEFWINDGLMTVFFLVVGLEIKRELLVGELSNIKQSMLPIIAALGGMVAPGMIHFFFNQGLETQSGWGVPTATDIAFSLAVLSLLGNKVPLSLKIFLTALAIMDDLGAIVVIAIFYSKSFSLFYFGGAVLLFVFLIFLNKQKVNKLTPYLLLGCLLWYLLLQSGIHATITGVLLAFAIPFRGGDKSAPSTKLIHQLHIPVAFFILPVFALANTGIIFENGWVDRLSNANSIGIYLGLLLGKPLGIVVFSAIGSLIGICKIPKGIHWLSFVGTAILAGIGFTMSIFISLLAFQENAFINESKMAVLFASVTAGLVGFLVLAIASKMKKKRAN